MSLVRWRLQPRLAACLFVLLGAALAPAQDSEMREESSGGQERQIYRSLTATHNYAANLYNSGDWAGCYRVFEGSLMTLRPMLREHPELQKSVNDSLALAQVEPSMVNRAWILRGALLKVRETLGPKKNHTGKPAEPEAQPRPLPRPEDQPLPEDQPKPKPKPKPVVKPKPEEEPRPKPTPEEKPQPEEKPKPRPEEKPKPKPEEKPKPRPEEKEKPRPGEKEKPKPEEKEKPRTGEKEKPKPEDQPKPRESRKTLWDRLGGEKGVSRIVDDVVATAARDPKVNFFRSGKVKLDAAGINRLKEHMIQQASAMAGGPLPYQGDSMKHAHKGMGITSSEFDAFLGHVKDALARNKVNAADADAVLKALNSKRKDIVEGKKTEPKKPEDSKPEDSKPEAKPAPKPADRKPAQDDPFAGAEDRTREKKPAGKDPFTAPADRPLNPPPADRPPSKKPARITAEEQSRIEGKVTFEGAPLTKGQIELHPATGKGIRAAITDGSYSLQVLPGEYQVTITSGGEAIPAVYSNRKKSPLTLKVLGGKQVFDVELK